MHLGALLAAENLVELHDLERALARQRERGGDLSQVLLDIGAIDPIKLDAVLARQPQKPKSIEETGLNASFLTKLVLKSMYLNGSDCAASLVQELKIPALIIQSLVDRLRQRQLIEPLGSAVDPNPNRPFDVHFTLSEAGRARAVEALERSEYVGPAPVPLKAFETQILKQRLEQEQVDREMLSKALSTLMMPRALVDRMGTALNSQQPILMYGPPGNGKSVISRAAAKCFRQIIYVPRCVEVDGEVIRVFDPTIHDEIALECEEGFSSKRSAVQQRTDDSRWVCCRRPFVAAGVELTLDMLDLNFHPRAHFYDGPLQMKASGGVLFIDDFGQQLARPIEILNRWNIPLEHGADYLTLETGKKFSCAFDVQLIFSTNQPLNHVLDTEIMRRIPYRIEVEPPSRSEFIELLKRECANHNIELLQDLRAYLIDELYDSKGRPYARYHPRFIVEHAIANAKYNRRTPVLNHDILAAAMQDLFTEASALNADS